MLWANDYVDVAAVDESTTLSLATDLLGIKAWSKNIQGNLLIVEAVAMIPPQAR